MGKEDQRLVDLAERSLSNWMPPLLKTAPRFAYRGSGARFEDVDGDVP